MKKAIKLITFILVVVMMFSVLSGCAMFGRNTEKYRSTAIAQVGDQTITVGEMLDAFNTQYNNYYYYIAQGYFTAEQVFELAADSLYSQAIKVDAYISKDGRTAETQNKEFKNGEYLTEAELAFVVRYVKYLMFSNFDTQVENFLADDFEFSAVEEEDTSRDFPEYDELGGAAYSAYVYNQNFVNEEMDEYMNDYYSFMFGADGKLLSDYASFEKDCNLDVYVLTDATKAQAMLQSYNDRLDEDATKLTHEQLVEVQNKVVRRYKTSIEKSYGYDLESFVKGQIESMIKSIIVAKYNYELYSAIDGANATETKAALTANVKGLAANQSADYLLNGSFDSTITGLTDSSYLYAVDSTEASKYIFVKNILVPFSAEQKQKLTNLAQTLGGTDSDKYIEERQKLAAEIIADDFTTTKDEEGNYQKAGKLFKIDGGKLVISDEGALADFLQNGVVTEMAGKTKTETIVELMKKYNTDTAQHSATFDYVVRVADDDNYTQPWVTEFVDAAKEAKGNGVNSYALCVSTYGVHIVYYSADVTAQDFNFDNVVGKADADTTGAAYKLFKSYFETESNSVVSKDMEALKEAYETNGRVVELPEFAKFIKTNKLDYSFEDMICSEDDDADSHEGHNHNH